MAAACPRTLTSPNAFEGNEFLNLTPAAQTDAPAYFASSALLHLEDGFSYLGRALGALMRGNFGAATHLAYYAELRAGLSLLTSAGVIVGKGPTISADRSGQLVRKDLKTGTHVAVWVVLKEYFDTPAAFDMLGEAVRPYGLTLEDWLSTADVAFAGAAKANAKDWLNAWSLDLEQFSHDKDSRVEQTYYPTRLNQFTPIDVPKFVTEMWELLEPAARGRFQEFDNEFLKVLLHSILTDAVEGETGLESDTEDPTEPTDPTELAQKKKRDLESELSDLGLEAGWDTFVTEDLALTSTVFAYAGMPDAPPWAIASRALILLRIAAGSVLRNLRASGEAYDQQLDTWAQEVIKERHLAPATPVAVEDLWADIDDAITSVRTEPEFSMRHEHGLRQLETSERILLWAVAS